MNKNKGFTLIELLAVIVILAIIALIATPMIMDVIDKARKGSAESSAYGYIQSVEDQSVYAMVEANDKEPLSEGIYEVNTVNDRVNIKGEKPSDGWVAVNSTGVVEAACLKFDSYPGSYVGYVAGGKAQAKVSDKLLDGKIVLTGDTKTTVAAAKTAMNDVLNPSASGE